MAIQKRTLVINGTERMFVCDLDNDTLADVIRKLGLTGTKVGCGTGQCGSCSILLDGKVVRSCARKMKAVNDYAVIETIEGIGTASNLHPLQLAWIVYGGVQCGFCTPGFIMSAKGLLQENPSPTREDVRDWFQKNRNACRCTGYKMLVDAVMAAAKVMRGEMTMEELSWKLPEDGKIYNTYIPRPNALGKVLGATDYGDDIAMKMPEGTLHLAVVQPKISHGNIKSIDTSEAEKMPGVFKVVTAKDIKGINRITAPLGQPRGFGDGFERPILLDEKVFRIGDVAAIVCADTEKNARAAAAMVKLDCEQLPEYLYAIDAMADDAVEIHPGIPNVYLTNPVFKGEDTRESMQQAEYVAEGSFYSSREPHLPIEPDVAQAYVDEEGYLTMHCKSLALHTMINISAAGLGWPKEKIRVIENPTGASFGYSISTITPMLASAAAIATGRPCSLSLNYKEFMQISGKRAPSYANGKMGCDADGKLVALEYEIAYDKGAYSFASAALVQKGQRYFGAPYTWPNITGLSKLTFSNHAYSTSYRGFGSPQCYTGSEQLIDMLAEKAGIDPWEIRYKNVYRPGDTTHTGATLTVYPMAALLEYIKPKYEELKARAKKESTPEKLLGVGIVCGMYNVTSAANDSSEVALELNPDGTVTNFNCWEAQGQGADIGSLVHTHEALRPLGLKPEQIRLVQNDTLYCPNTGPAAGSRSHYMAGNATIDAANKLMDAMRKPDGTFRTYDEMVAENIPTKYLGVSSTADRTVNLDPNTGEGNPTPEHTYGVFTCMVEVEAATGKVKVLEYHGAADVGIIGNYLAVDGQAYGGMMHGIGFALSEDYQDVNKHTSLIGAGFPYIDMIPDGEHFTIHYNETPRPDGPQGSGGCSELFQTSTHTVVLNAIANATGGARVYEIPATPEKVKAAMDKLAKGDTAPPPRYYLGGDFYDVVDDIRANPVEVV